MISNDLDQKISQLQKEITGNECEINRPQSCKMQIFTGTSWGPERIEKHIKYGIGMVCTPNEPKAVQPNKIDPRIPVIWDNGAFHGFDEKRYAERMSDIKRPVIFAVLPDVPMKAKESLELSKKWLNAVPFKRYLAIQDGVTFNMIHPLLSKCEGGFLGGSTEWKWREMQKWINLCHSIGLPLHVGRCNGLQQWDRAAILGADSCDGSTAARHNMIECIPRFYQHFTQQQRFVHYIDKEDLMLSIGAAVCQERSA